MTEFGFISSARVNRGRSEALVVGEDLEGASSFQLRPV